MQQKYLIVVEHGPTSYGAYAPDVPGCGTSGDTPEEALRLIKEALELYFKVESERGGSLPKPTHVAAQFLDVDLPVQASQHAS